MWKNVKEVYNKVVGKMMNEERARQNLKKGGLCFSITPLDPMDSELVNLAKVTVEIKEFNIV